jgi:Ca2+-binding RTX toxin-like protein
MRIPLAVLTVTGTLVLPAVAAAAPSTVSHDSATSTTTFRSGSDASDLRAIEPLTDPPRVEFTDDGNPLTVGPGCTPGSPAFCPIGTVDIRLSADGDQAEIFTVSSTVNVTAGLGDDDLRASQIRGVTRGGAGDDSIRANSREAQVFGDGGNDDVYVFEDFMRAYGGDGNDLLTTDADPTSLEGGDGYDILIAGGYASLDGGDDADIIGFFDGAENGQPINGGGGGDSIHASVGGEPISGGPGNDEIYVDGGGADTVNCGSGFDVVYADAGDSVAANCERRSAGPGPVDTRFEDALWQATLIRGGVNRRFFHIALEQAT